MTLSVPSVSPVRKALGWSVHLVTATGAVWGLLAIVASIRQDWQAAVFWMALAVLVDGLDGSLARLFQVKQVLPDFDGALLDNMVDYLNYVLVPAIFLVTASLLPENLAVAVAAMILLASAYQFCQADAKTEDHYFKGFPSYWNVVAIYLLLLALSPWANLAILVVLTLLVFVPLKYLYPSRTEPFRRTTMLLTAVWTAMGLAIVAQFPDPDRWLVWLSLFYFPYYVGVSLYLNFRPAGNK